MLTIAQYLNESGGSGVVVLSSEQEDSRGMGHVTLGVDVIVCLVDETPFRMTLKWSANHLKGGGPSAYVDEREKIRRDEYDALVAARGVLDTADFYARRERNAARRTRDGELREKLDQLKPRCPKCRGATQLRNGRHGPFWGCTAFQSTGCKGVGKVSAAKQAVIDGIMAELKRTD